MKDKIYKLCTRVWDTHLNCEVVTYKLVQGDKLIREEIILSTPEEELEILNLKECHYGR